MKRTPVMHKRTHRMASTIIADCLLVDQFSWPSGLNENHPIILSKNSVILSLSKDDRLLEEYFPVGLGYLCHHDFFAAFTAGF